MTVYALNVGHPTMIIKKMYAILSNYRYGYNCLLCSQFKFIVEEDIALPVDPKFWDYLLSNAQIDWQLFVYEQDFLLTQFGKTKALQVIQNYCLP